MPDPPHGPPEITEAQQAATAIEGVGSPTPDNVSRAVQNYSPGAVAAAAASIGVSGGGGGGGGSLPANVTWDENDLIVNDDDAQTVFRLKTLVSAGLQMTVRMAAFFTDALTVYNDNGAELFETDPLANGGDGEVRISGQVVPQDLSGYQQTPEKGQPDGYASLDGDAIVPLAQLPEIPAVVPDVPFASATTPTLAQGSVTATIDQFDCWWQRVGRIVFVRLFITGGAEGELGEPWVIDLPAGVPAAEFSLGQDSAIAVGSGYASISLEAVVISVQLRQDAGGPGPTRRLGIVGPEAPVGTLGAADQMQEGRTIQAFLTYEAAAAA